MRGRKAAGRVLAAMLALAVVMILAGCSFRWPVGKPCPPGSHRDYSLITHKPVPYCEQDKGK